MHRLGWIGLAGGRLFMSVAWANGPLPAPAQYTTHNYGLTFATPAGSTYCPLPQGWMGSDHGTVLFPVRPRACAGAGYPSSGRGFSPTSTPRIEVYYAYWMGEDEPKSPPCHVDGWTSLMGRRRAICLGHRDGMITEAVSARYSADLDRVTVTLVTVPARRERDLAAFDSLTASVQSCATHFTGGAGKTVVSGTGQACPVGGWF